MSRVAAAVVPRCAAPVSCCVIGSWRDRRPRLRSSFSLYLQLVVGKNMATESTPKDLTRGGRKELIAEFDRLQITHETIEHPEVFTVEAMMPHIQHLSGAFCKNLFVKDKKKRLYLLTALHDRPIQLNAVAKKLGASGGLRFADESTLLEKLGVGQGSVTPFAIFNDKAGDVKFVLDSDIANGGHAKLFGHPMVNTASTAISPEDLMKFAKETNHEPILLNFSDL